MFMIVTLEAKVFFHYWRTIGNGHQQNSRFYFIYLRKNIFIVDSILAISYLPPTPTPPSVFPAFLPAPALKKHFWPALLQSNQEIELYHFKHLHVFLLGDGVLEWKQNAGLYDPF